MKINFGTHMIVKKSKTCSIVSCRCCVIEFNDLRFLNCSHLLFLLENFQSDLWFLVIFEKKGSFNKPSVLR